MNRLAARLAIFVGAVLAVISFFMPWVVARTLETVLPLLGALGDLLNEGVSDVIGGAAQYTSLTGWQLAADVPWVTAWFKIPVLLPLILAGVALLWLLVALATRLQGGRAVELALATGCVVTAALLIFNAGSISHLAVKAGLIGTAMNVMGFNLATGYWLSLAALLLMASGFFLGVSNAPVAVEDDDTSYY